MVEKDRIVRVQNRDFGKVGYGIPDLNLHREFQPNEVKDITFEELFKLMQTPGGDYIINNYLIIYDEEVISELLNNVEPEYYYTEEQVKELMLNGSLDEFEDCLNFAPKGVIDLIKEIAVQLPLNDVAKRDLILKKTGFSVANAIELIKTDDVVVTEAPKRKAAVPTANKPVRKVVKPSTK
ncbi:MAG TPA: hypothetical protein DCL29_06890 [Eubacterium sp.]|nr:hypothetical protein [Eubacterium sp.]